MSENSLDDLIAKVKTEAIDSAEQEALKIINDAKEKAAIILKSAQKESEALVNSAAAESEQTLKKGEIALKQAARDVNIALKNDIVKLFNSVFESNIKEHFSKDIYVSIINKFIDSLEGNISIALPDEMEDQLVNSIKKQVSESGKIKEIIKDRELFSGLSVSKTDEGWSYTITAEEIAELMGHHLSQRWLTILNS